MTLVAGSAGVDGRPAPSGRRHWLRDADLERLARALDAQAETVLLRANDAAGEAGDPTAVPVLLPVGGGTKAGSACRCLLLPDLAEVVSIVADYLASHEREARHKLQAKGIASARARGVRFGRPSTPLPRNFPKALAMWRAGNLSASEAARLCGMRTSTFYRHAKAVLRRDSIKDAGNTSGSGGA